MRLMPLILCGLLSCSNFALAEGPMMQLDPDWRYVADEVMGGVSQGQAAREEVAGRMATRLTGAVSTDNNGGFIQIAFDLSADASGFNGIEIDVRGNAEDYDLRLRTTALNRPWQSFRLSFNAPQEWTTLRLPFARFEPHRTDAAFDPAQLRRIGVLAVGREFQADIAVAGIRLYR